MAIKNRPEIPITNDIQEFSEEMLEEMEALRRIVGKSDETELSTEDKEEKVDFADSKTEDHGPSPKERKPGCKKKVALRKLEDKGNAENELYNFQVRIPKEYELKLRYLRTSSDSMFLDTIRASVIQIIDEAWDESKERIAAQIKKII